MTDKTYAIQTTLVTGANSGLGFEAAAQLAEAGFGRVILACRTLEKAEIARDLLVQRVGSDPFETLAVDVSSIRSSEEASAELIRRNVAIDALLLNAGLVAGKEMQKKMALEVGLPPTRSSVYTEEEVVAKYRWYPTQLKALEASKVRPRLPEWLEMDVKIGTYLNLALVGDMTPEEALNALNDEIADILGQ